MTRQNFSRIASIILYILGLFLVVYVRAINFSVESVDMHYFVLPWYDFIVAHGVFKAFAFDFYNYNPPYLYLLALTTLLPWLPKIAAVKLLSCVFDIVAAVAVYRIVVFEKKDPLWGLLGAFAMLLLPTVFIESGHWGQCDILYTAFLLFMLDSLLREKYVRGLIFFSIAFVFKFQAVFLAPIILYLLFKRKLSLYSLLYPVGIYLLSILPAWLAGRPFLDLVKIYFSQADLYHSLSSNAPSIYFPWSNGQYYSTANVLIGLGIVSIFTLLFLIFRCRQPMAGSTKIYLFDACLLTFFVPMLTPKMHERYFFPAALLFMVVVFYDKKAVFWAFLIQISSMLSYINFLYLYPGDLTFVAFIINLGLIIPILVWYYFKNKEILTGENLPLTATSG